MDLEFLLQCLLLRDAQADAALLAPRDTPGLLSALAAGGHLDAGTAAALLAAHAVLLDAGLRCTLDRRPRLAAETDAIAGARATIRAAVHAHGLDAVEDAASA